MEYKISQREHGICLECGQEITYGRTDKKFCCDTCKNRYHNKSHKDTRTLHHKVLSGIEKNYSILVRLYDMSVKSIDIGDLLAMGFRIEYSTGYRKNRSHDEYRCFEFKYYLTSSRMFNIQKTLPFQ